jgi:hypothetical protein
MAWKTIISDTIIYLKIIERMTKKMSNYNDVKYSSLTSIYLTARGFQNNYEDLKKQLVKSTGQITYDNLMPVAATNGFFAVELYLKLVNALTYWENREGVKENPSNLTKFPTGHNLKKLFDSIDDKSKQEIIEKLPLNINEVELLNRLEEYKDGFMEWRYFFEKECMHGDFVFLSNILKSLYLYCNHYMELKYNPKEEWLNDSPHTSTTIHQAQVYSEEELSELMNLNLEEAMSKAKINES